MTSGTSTAAVPPSERRRASALIPPGLLLGIGLGGFVDGVVLHQVLQWHHMLTGLEEYPSTTVAGLEANTLGDGLFHLATLIATTVGVLLLAARVRDGIDWSTRMFVGLMLAGWGAFNLAEGTVDHHVLGLHHVKADTPALDLAFLSLGAVLLAGGLALARRGERSAEARGRAAGSR